MIHADEVKYLTNRSRGVICVAGPYAEPSEAEWAIQGMLDADEYSYIVEVNAPQWGNPVRGLLFADEWQHDLVDIEDQDKDTPPEKFLVLCGEWLAIRATRIERAGLHPFFGPLSGPYHRMEVGFFVPFKEAAKYTREQIVTLIKEVFA